MRAWRWFLELWDGFLLAMETAEDPHVALAKANARVAELAVDAERRSAWNLELTEKLGTLSSERGECFRLLNDAKIAGMCPTTNLVFAVKDTLALFGAMKVERDGLQARNDNQRQQLINLDRQISPLMTQVLELRFELQEVQTRLAGREVEVALLKRCSEMNQISSEALARILFAAAWPDCDFDALNGSDSAWWFGVAEAAARALGRRLTHPGAPSATDSTDNTDGGKKRCLRCGFLMGTFQVCRSAPPAFPGAPCRSVDEGIESPAEGLDRTDQTDRTDRKAAAEVPSPTSCCPPGADRVRVAPGEGAPAVELVVPGRVCATCGTDVSRVAYYSSGSFVCRACFDRPDPTPVVPGGIRYVEGDLKHGATASVLARRPEQVVLDQVREIILEKPYPGDLTEKARSSRYAQAWLALWDKGVNRA
jgi:hypothetical protein